MSRLREWHPGRPWATNLALGGLGFALVCLTRQFVSENDHFTIGFSGVSGWSAVVYVAAVFVILTQPVNRYTFGIIVAFAVACRLVPLYSDPFSSSDIYRYVWDGVVQHAHINPYRYVPGDQALAFLRAPNQDVFDSMNRRDYARTIYPPVAQMIYFAATWISPTVEMMKTAMIGFECLTVGAMVALLRLMGRPREQALLYAWCPLLVWEIGGAGHLDAAVIAFVLLALLFRAKGNNVLTGLFLALAIMTKFYPLVLFPALYRRGDWKMPATVMGVVAIGYSVYASAGKLVFGFLGGYTKEEGLVSGTRYFLLQWIQSFRALQNTSTTIYMLFCAVVSAAIAIWACIYATNEFPLSYQNRFTADVQPAFLEASAMFAFALMLLFSPHYPWYVLWLIPFFALVPNVPMLVYLMGVFYLFTTYLADPGPKMFLLNRILYGSTICAFGLHFILRCWPVHRLLRPMHADVLMPELRRE